MPDSSQEKMETRRPRRRDERAHGPACRRTKKKSNLLEKGFPEIWTLDFLKIHNCIINSSVIIDKNILVKEGMVPYNKRGQDYKCWLNVLKHTNSIYITDICFYYDIGHGYGSNH